MFRKTLAFTALALGFAAAASAQSAGYYLENSGRINQAVTVYASVNGAGGSLSHADGSAQAIANGAVVQLPGSVSVTGDVAGFNKATAYNTSMGAGQGSATSNGWSDATTYGNATSVIPTGYVTVAGSVDGGMVDPVRNGTDVHINAGTAQDGFANASYNGGFAVNGNVAATPIAGGWSLVGNVQSAQYSEAQVAVGGVTFSGGTPAGQTAADRSGNAGVVVNIDGRFDDPARQ